MHLCIEWSRLGGNDPTSIRFQDATWNFLDRVWPESDDAAENAEVEYLLELI